MLETIVIIMIVAIVLWTVYSLGRIQGQKSMFKSLGTGISSGVIKIDRKTLEKELKRLGIK